MWIFTVDGFFSTVENLHDPGQVMIRARKKEDLIALLDRLDHPDLGREILDNIGTDYAHRIFVDKPVWAEYLALVANVDYTNFKARALAGEEIQSPRDKAYHRVWGVMKDWQDGRLDPKPAQLIRNGQLSLWDTYRVPGDEDDMLDQVPWDDYEDDEPDPDQFTTPLKYEKALERWSLGVEWRDLVDKVAMPESSDFETDEKYSLAINLWLKGLPYDHLTAKAEEIGPESPFWIQDDELGLIQ